MPLPDLDKATKAGALRFLDRYLATMTDIEQLRRDIGDDRWADGVTNDPAVWFEWVQAFWESRGAVFLNIVEPGANPFTMPGAAPRSLLVPYDGSDPVLGDPGVDFERGGERTTIDAFRRLVVSWPGTLEKLRDSMR